MVDKIKISSEVKRMQQMRETLLQSMDPQSDYSRWIESYDKAADIRHFSQELIQVLDKIPGNRIPGLQNFANALRNLESNPQFLQQILNENPELKALIEENIKLIENVHKAFRASQAKNQSSFTQPSNISDISNSSINASSNASETYYAEAMILRQRVADVQKKLENLPTLGGGSYGRHADLAEQRSKIYKQVIDRVYDLTAHAAGEKQYTADELNNKVKKIENDFNDLKLKVGNQLSNEIKIVLQQIKNQKQNLPQNLPYKPEEYLAQLKQTAKMLGVDLGKDVSKKLDTITKNHSKRAVPLTKSKISNKEAKGLFSLIKNFVKHIKDNLVALTLEHKKGIKAKK